jgi:hypothetical protein
MKTLEAIDAEMAGLNAQRDALKDKLRQLEKERNVVVIAKELESMPDSRKDALRQILGPQGIPSEEKFGNIGE